MYDISRIVVSGSAGSTGTAMAYAMAWYNTRLIVIATIVFAALYVVGAVAGSDRMGKFDSRAFLHFQTRTYVALALVLAALPFPF